MADQSPWLKRCAQAFALGGEIGADDPHYRPREGQQRMAALIAQTIASSGTLIVEAGTGTGKTFAYLVPAL